MDFIQTRFSGLTLKLLKFLEEQLVSLLALFFATGFGMHPLLFDFFGHFTLLPCLFFLSCSLLFFLLPVDAASLSRFQTFLLRLNLCFESLGFFSFALCFKLLKLHNLFFELALAT
mmetsp:Transcript_13642/g.17261  ORF Transcript_13642/g.17261 Transcript_13642/m.17261 type:complete len:116 (+) Transcript_13642:544-891(+)